MSYIRNIKLAGQLAKTNSTMFDRIKYYDLPKLDQSCITHCALPPAPNIKIIESVDLTTRTNSTMLGRFKYDDLLNVDQKYTTPCALPPAFHIQNINTPDLIAKTNSTILDESKYDEPFNNISSVLNQLQIICIQRLKIFKIQIFQLLLSQFH